jgi:hypothetical protein
VRNSNVKLRFVGCAFLIAAALSGCGGPDTSDPLSACKSAVSAVCDRSFQCFPTGSQQLYGTLSDCNSRLSTLSCSPALTTCPAGTTFNPGGASRCVDAYRTESCADLLNSVIPASCNQNCN